MPERDVELLRKKGDLGLSGKGTRQMVMKDTNLVPSLHFVFLFVAPHLLSGPFPLPDLH